MSCYSVTQIKGLHPVSVGFYLKPWILLIHSVSVDFYLKPWILHIRSVSVHFYLKLWMLHIHSVQFPEIRSSLWRKGLDCLGILSLLPVSVLRLYCSGFGYIFLPFFLLSWLLGLLPVSSIALLGKCIMWTEHLGLPNHLWQLTRCALLRHSPVAVCYGRGMVLC